ncbi:MAG: hypothetical protein ACLT0Y_08900 [Christensenellales bacterium]
MQFAKRMDAFSVGIFNQLAETRARRLSQGLPVVDLSVGAPNIPPAPHVMQALSQSALTRKTTSTPLDTQPPRRAVSDWVSAAITLPGS